MEWLLESLLGDDWDMGILWGQLTQALACRHCGSSCFQSPGTLVTLFLFMVWQIQRWWQLGKWQQLQPWYSGDMMQGKDLPLLHRWAFLDRLWKHTSEEEEEEGDEEEAEVASLNHLKAYSLPQEAPIGEEATTGSSRTSCGSDDAYKTTGTPEQVLMQTPNPSSSFPIFQILTNLPARHNGVSGRCLQQQKSQFFWGFPSLHSESLEAIFLSSGGPSPLKLSLGLSVFFNKFASLSGTNLLFPRDCFPTQLPTHEAHTTEDLERMALDPQQLPLSSPSPVPSLPLHLKPFPMDNKGVLSGPEAHTQWLRQQREVLRVSEEQALHPQPKLQRTRKSKLFTSPEVQWGVPWDLGLQHHILEPLSAPPFYPSSLLVLTGSEVPSRTMGQNEDTKASEPPVPAPNPVSLPELQEINPIRDLSGSQALWETTKQRKKIHTCEPSILATCQPRAPVTGPEGINPLGMPPGYETQWGSISHKKNLQVSEAPMPPTPCQPLYSLSTPQKVNPEGGCFVPTDFWRTVGHKETSQVSGSPMPALPSPPDPLAELQGGRPLGDPFGYKSQWGCRENSGKPWAFDPLALSLNPVLHETSPACVPSISENSGESIQGREILWVSVDSVSSPNLPSVSLLESLVVGPQGVLSESKALWDSTGQRENSWTSQSPAPAHSPPLDPILESPRVSGVGGFTRSDAARKDTEHSSKSEPLSLALSSPLALTLESLRVSFLGVLFDSENRCGNVQGKKNPWVSKIPDYSLLQNPYDTSPLGLLFASEPVWRDMGHKEINCVPVSPAWGPSPPSNSMSKSDISEPSNRKPEGEAMKERENSWATKLPAAIPSSAPLPNPHTDLAFVNTQHRAIPQGSSPPAVDLLKPTPWLPTLPDTLKIEPQKSGQTKGTPFPGVKAETLPSQGEAVLGVPTHSGVQAWHWSTELEARLKKLQQSPASRSPGPSQSFGSCPALNSTTPGSRGLSSCPPQQTNAPSMCPHSSSCHLPKVRSTVTQPVQASHCHHPNTFSQCQLGGSDRAKQGSERKENMKAKMVVQVSSQRPCCHMKAGENCPGLGEPSDLKVPVSGKRQDKTSALSSANERVSPRRPKEIDGGGDARLGSSTVKGKSHPTQAQRLVEAAASTISQRSHSRGQSSRHTLPQLLNSKVADFQDQRGAGMGAGDTPILRHCKHCPWAHMKHRSSTPQDPLTRGLRRVIAKFVGTNGPCSPRSVSREKAGSTGTQLSQDVNSNQFGGGGKRQAE
ncbi:uncharacterized protein C9orf131 homolog [Talpa occidentalis]|uniref:uncharacterized protein C9orf131 homolog n=1 Tax=Talpa occidentalis TaxID=50954 RepID=UPI00188F5C13|nr:uncharacterized protein C9orf131 homolog [Talpa occidentalis]